MQALRDPGALEREARRLGMVRQGERPYVIEGLQEAHRTASLGAVSYSVENALYQWREGERRLRETSEPARADLERAADAVVEELRRRLGSALHVGRAGRPLRRGHRLGHGPRRPPRAGTDAATVVDAAFSRYAREASDFAGGRARETARSHA